MEKAFAKVLQFADDSTPVHGVRLGRIVRIEESGDVFVDFSGNSSGPILARTTTSSRSKAQGMANAAGMEVLLVFENQDQRHPIIIDTMYSLEGAEPATAAPEPEEIQDITVNGKRIMFGAENEMVLKCGKASITLTKAGKILIKGEHVISTSHGENRIKGGSIIIN